MTKREVLPFRAVRSTTTRTTTTATTARLFGVSLSLFIVSSPFAFRGSPRFGSDRIDHPSERSALPLARHERVYVDDPATPIFLRTREELLREFFSAIVKTEIVFLFL